VGSLEEIPKRRKRTLRVVITITKTIRRGEGGKGENRMRGGFQWWKGKERSRRIRSQVLRELLPGESLGRAWGKGKEDSP